MMPAAGADPHSGCPQERVRPPLTCPLAATSTRPRGGGKNAGQRGLASPVSQRIVRLGRRGPRLGGPTEPFTEQQPPSRSGIQTGQLAQASTKRDVSEPRRVGLAEPVVQVGVLHVFDD